MITFAAATEAAFLLAQAAPSIPIAPVVPVEPNTVVVPYGAYIDTALTFLAAGIGTLVTYAFRWVPGQLQALALTMRVDQLLIRAITYGINSTREATRDKVLSFEVSNRVLREALAYALLHGGVLVKSFMGSPEDIAEKIWSRMNVAPEVAKPNLGEVARVVAADVSIAKPIRDSAA